MADLTYKYELKGKRTKRLLRRHAWACNQVWNFCVQIQRKVQRNRREGLSGKWLNFYALKALTTGVSQDLGIHAQTVQNVVEQFVKSRDQHRKCPKFRKSGGAKRSLGWVPFQTQSRKITSTSVTYLKHTMRFFGTKRRPLPEDDVKGGSFVQDARGRWYVCFHVEVPNDKHSGIGDVGIDLGLKSLAVTSDGGRLEASQFYRKSEAVLATAQRAGNRKRAREINARIKNQRIDQAHKFSAEAVQTYGTIYVGDVSSSKLMKTKMAKSVGDAGWSMLRNMLRYKASRHGALFVEIEEKFTTQRCSCCGDIPGSSPKGKGALGIRVWVCSTCGAIHDRDVNAAKNILALGRSAAPPAEESRVAHGR
jgi:IS605 OrfB family transposase